MPLPSGHVVTADEFAAAASNFLEVNSASAAWSFPTGTSASYENVTNATGAFAKSLSGSASKLVAKFNLSAFSTVITTKMKVGIRIGSTDYDILPGFLFSVANTHTPGIGAEVDITGVAAGSYNPQLRVLRVSGTGVLTMDTGDFGSFSLREVIL